MRILFLLLIRVFPTLLVGPVFRGVNLENGCTDGNYSRIKIYFFFVGCDPFSNVKIEEVEEVQIAVLLSSTKLHLVRKNPQGIFCQMWSETTNTIMPVVEITNL